MSNHLCMQRNPYSALTMLGVNTSGDGPMKNRTIAIIMVAAAFGGDFCLPASAQSSIGGIKKQTPLAAPVKQTPLGGPAKPISPPVKPTPVAGPVKPTSPVVPVKPATAAVAPSAQSKCPTPPCGAKGTH
jgi:hypothetical protein